MADPFAVLGNNPSQLDASQLQDEPLLKRYGKQFVRGATLGFAGSKREPEGVGEHVAEFAGGILPVAAISAVASPVVGAGLRLLKVPKIAIPLTSRLATGGAIGAGTQAGYDISQEDETSLGRVGLGAATGLAQEALFLGGAKLLSKARARQKVKLPGIETPSETASHTADVVDEAMGVRALPPSMRHEPLALPATGESTVTQPGFEVLPQPSKMSARKAAGLSGGTRELEQPGFGTKKAIFELNPRTGEVKPFSFDVEQTRAKFHIGKDPETKLNEFISKDSVTDSAIDLASRNYRMPTINKNVSITDLENMGFAAAKAIGWEKGREGGWMFTGITPQILNTQSKVRLDLNTKIEPLKTENILKQTDETATRLLEGEAPKSIDYVKMDYTPEALEALEIGKKIGMDEGLLSSLMDAAQQIKDPLKRNKLILDQLRRYCEGT